MTSLTERAAGFVLNEYKHHAGFLRGRVAAAGRGDVTLPALAAELVVVGTELMDLYYGPVSVRAVKIEIAAALAAAGVAAERGAVKAWCDGNNGWRAVTLVDTSVWIVRAVRADDPAAVAHLHPGRHVPLTRRVRANALRTAVLAAADLRACGASVPTRDRVNRIRVNVLRLPKILDWDAATETRALTDLLRRSG